MSVLMLVLLLVQQRLRVCTLIVVGVQEDLKPGSGNVFAHTIAQDKQHPLAEPFHIDRFTTGALIDEHGAAGVAH